MPRYPKDIVELVASRTNRHILRILHEREGLVGAEINDALFDAAKIRFKSTSTLTEALQCLVEHNLVRKENARYYLSSLSKERWIARFLNILVQHKIDKGANVK